MADHEDMSPASAAAAHHPSSGTEPGDTVGGYELLREIGRGGMAEVWLARRARATAGKFVAIKMILPQYVGVERYSRMFATEAEVSAPLSHSNICQVFDEGEDRGRSYIVMEWVDGADLAQLLPNVRELRRRDPALRLRVAAYVVGQILHGLSYAHKITSHRGKSLGIVHRDISPQNVLVSVSGDVKVTDFGIAHRMIEETSGINVKGKLRYMAPEQLAGSSHAPTVDLYAVGAILHELLDGEKFRRDADGQVALYHQVMSKRVPPLASTDVPPELAAVRNALLDPDPGRRPQTADAAVLMLKRWPGYSEMRVELGMLCGLATGVVRPRTGPIVAPGVPTVPPRATQRGTAASARGPGEPDAPVAPWGVVPPPASGTADATTMLADGELHSSVRARSEPTLDVAYAHTGVPEPIPPAYGDRRDLEPTHSAIDARWTPPSGTTPTVETTISSLDVQAARPRSSARVWLLAAAAGVLAMLGAGATTLYLVLAEPQRATTAVAPATVVELPAASDATEAEPPAAPDLSPRASAESPPVSEAVPTPRVAITPPDVASTPVATPPPTAVEPAAAPAQPSRSKAAPTKRAGTKPKAAPAALGPDVTVHILLDGGLVGVDVKLGARIIAVRPRFDGRVASGKYAAKYRVSPSDAWTSVGTVEIGATGEWKLVVAPGGAWVKQL